MDLVFHKDYLQTDKSDSSYVCSREQARAILAKKTTKYKQDTELVGKGRRHDQTTHNVIFGNGHIEIGCVTFNKKEIARVREWLRKPTKKTKK